MHRYLYTDIISKKKYIYRKNQSFITKKLDSCQKRKTIFYSALGIRVQLLKYISLDIVLIARKNIKMYQVHIL